MATNNKFLKALLASTAVTAISMSGSAFAVTVNSQGASDPLATATGGDWDAAISATGDTLKLHAAVGLTHDDAAVTSVSIDLNSKALAGKALTISKSLTVTAVSNAGASVFDTADIANTYVLTLGGTASAHTSELADVFNLAGTTAELVISSTGGTTTLTKIDNSAGADSKGILTVNESLSVGTIGATNTLDTATVESGKTLTVTGGTAKIDDLTLKGTLVADTAALTFTGNIDGSGTESSLTATENLTVTGTIGAGTAVKSAIVAASKTLEVRGATDITTVTLGDTSTFKASTNAVAFTGDIDSTATNSLIDASHNLTITGNVGATNAIATLTAATGKVVTISGGTTHNITEVKLAGAASELAFNKDGMTLNGKVTAGTASQGILTVTESATITGDVGAAAAKLASGTIATGKTLTLESDYYSSGNMVLTGTGTMKIAKANAVIDGAIKGNGANEGIIIVEDAATFKAALGSTALQELTLSGASKTVEVQDDATTKALVFSADATLKLSGISTTTIGADNITTATDGTGSILVTNTHTLSVSQVGTSSKKLKDITVSGDKILTLDTASAKYYVPFVSATDGENTLAISEAATFYSDIGTTSAKYKAVNFGANKTITLDAGVNINAPVTATTSTHGTVTANGGLNINSDFGTTSKYIGTLNLGATEASAVSNINADLHVGTFNVKDEAHTVNIKKDLTIGYDGSTVDLSKATLNLDEYKLTTKANITVDSTTKFKTTIVTSEDYGNIDNTDGAAITFETDMVVDVVSKTYNPSARTITLIKGGATPVDADKLAVTTNGIVAGDGLVKWVASESDGNVILTATRNKTVAAYATASKIQGAGSVIAAELDRVIAAGTELTGTSSAFMGALEGMTADEVADSVSSLTVAQADAANSANVNAANETVGTRVANVGVAAGNFAQEVGVWTEVFGSKAKNKLKSGYAGSNSSTFGGTIGVDVMPNENHVLGMAVSYADTNMKHKDYKNGDKTDVKSTIFSLYSSHGLDNNFFINPNAAFGQSKVKSKEAEKASGKTKVGKYDSAVYSVGLAGGYTHKLSDAVNVVPMASLSYTNFLDGGYTQTGGSYNLTVNKRDHHAVVASLGARLNGKVVSGNIEVTPSAHAFVNHDFNAKAVKSTTSMDGGLAFVQKGVKPDATSFNLGAGLMGKMDNMEFGVRYDAKLSSKTTRHTGVVKMRVNF